MKYLLSWDAKSMLYPENFSQCNIEDYFENKTQAFYVFVIEVLLCSYQVLV